MRIFVTTSMGHTITLEVQARHTISFVKTMIEDIANIHPINQRLILADKQLADSFTVGYYNIQTESKLRLHEHMKLWVLTPTGRTIPVETWDVDTIDTVKAKIMDKTGYPMDQQRLMLEEKELENGWQRVSDYMIHKDSNLRMILRG